MAHPVITAQMSAQTPNVTLHTPSGGRHNPNMHPLTIYLGIRSILS